MLTDEQKYQNKMKYLELVSKLNIDITALVEYLDSVDYFNKPATTSCFNAYSGGLCKYAIDLCYELATLCNAYFPGKYSNEDIIKVALFRDIYRAELYEFYTKNIKNETTGQWESVGAYKSSDAANRQVFGDINFSSYMIIKNFIALTEEQIEAICFSRSTEYTADLFEIRKRYPLVTLLTMADMSVSYLNAMKLEVSNE